MPAYILFEDHSHLDLQPFTFTRPIYFIRSGILNFYEKWTKTLKSRVYSLPFSHLKEVFEELPQENDVVGINGKFGPDSYLLEQIQEIPPNSFLSNEKEEVLIFRTQKGRSLFGPELQPDRERLLQADMTEHKTQHEALGIRQLSDIFSLNRDFIIRDFELLTRTEKPQKLSDPYTHVYGRDNLFISEGAKIRASIINAEDGPIYIGKNATVKEGSIILNAHGIGENSTVSVGAKLRGDSSIGPWVKVGGEVGNSVIMGYANKGHDGYLGNSVLGYWCNLGADTNTSNLKNNYGNIRVWNYPARDFRDTGLQFHGLMMGDHSKAGINTMFNTGTVVGVSANIFGGGFPPKFVPSFAWGGAEGFQTYQWEKALDTAARVMARREISLTAADKKLLHYIFEQTRIFRNWEH